MKKTILYAFAFAALSVSVSSCKCNECEHDFLPNVDVCRDDFDNNKDYKDAIEGFESAGYKCAPGN